ncbi:MAG: elongation factor EF-2, partial [Candidatus Bathyarchaeia archaeon]
SDFLSHVIGIVQKRRGRLIDITSEEDIMLVKAELPVAESFGLADEIRSSTQGRAFWATQFSRWAPVPDSMQIDVITQIRKRKGLSPEIPKPEEYCDIE